MTLRFRRARIALAATAAMTMLVTACGSGGSSDDSSSSQDTAGFPVSIPVSYTHLTLPTKRIV